MKIEEAAFGTSVNSTIKSFSCHKDGCGSFQALIRNNAGDAKHCYVSKKMLNLLQNSKLSDWDCPLENHVSNHRQDYDDLLDFLHMLNVLSLDRSKRLRILLIALPAPMSPSKKLHVFSGITPTTCKNFLKLCLVP